MTISLNVNERTKETDVSKTRLEGNIPAVVYGPKQEPVLLSVEKKQFEKIFAEAGESTIIELSGLKESLEVLVHDVSFDPVKGGIVHVDFYAIERGKEMRTHVPLEFINEAPAEKSGSTVNKILHEIDITCRPSDLPQHIDVDLSVLMDEDSSITVADLKIPSGVTVETEPHETVANISAARVEEEQEEVVPVDMSEIEVAGKKKEVESEPESE